MSIKEKFNDLDPKQKKIVIWSIVGALVLAVTLVGYNSRSQRIAERKVKEGEKERQISLNPDLIQKTMLGEQRRRLEQLSDEIKELKEEQNRLLKAGLPAGANKEAAAKNNAKKGKLPAIPEPDKIEQADQSWPVPLDENGKPMRPGSRQRQGGRGPAPAVPPAPTVEPVMIGEITVVSNSNNAQGDQGVAGDKKKGRTVYLPPSFMEAQLLTGFDASTSGRGKSNPEPLLLRIQTPAVLPNDVKAELEGCFVVAEAVGRLDKERADVRLVSLSCLTNEGKAVIDTPIKGFVTDSDSKVGLSGRVVSRMGAAAARAVVAGFFGGMGDMLKAASTTTSVSPLGSTQTVDGSQIAKYSLGGGLAEGADSLHDFYLDMAKQATPVIEVGAAKKITVIISEGKELEIREIENDESF